MHAPWRDLAAEDGARFAFGRAVTPLPRVDRARCVLALGADPFADAPDAAADGLASFAVETTPSRAGSRAVDRIALPPARIEAWLWRLAAHWMPEVEALALEPGWSDATRAFEHRVVDALRDAGEAALILPGPGLSPETHALALALNQRLGAIGGTLALIEPPDAAQGVGTLADLVHALQDDNVDALVVIGANPVHDAPAAFGLPLALRRARLLVHAGTRVDEAAAQADWHLPLALWGDALGADGSAALLQPVIAPPAQARSASELLALLAGDELRDGWSLLRRQWHALWSRDAGETLWRDSLRHGVVRASASPTIAPPEARLPTRRVLPADTEAPTLTALFVPARACLADDALLLSPATADATAAAPRTSTPTACGHPRRSARPSRWNASGLPWTSTDALAHGRQAGAKAQRLSSALVQPDADLNAHALPPRMVPPGRGPRPVRRLAARARDGHVLAHLSRRSPVCAPCRPARRMTRRRAAS